MDLPCPRVLADSSRSSTQIPPHVFSVAFVHRLVPSSVFLVRFLGHVTTLNQERLLRQDLSTLPLAILASPNFPQTMIPLARIPVTGIIPDTISYPIGLALALSIVEIDPSITKRPLIYCANFAL
jgi:dolichyl-phosphate-mannose--protein O-mannosyl transferase